MIRLFVSDIDGCLSMPYRPWRMDILGKLSGLAATAGLPDSDPSRPSFSICSGRSYPYVEAMSQALGLVTPVLFESGAGMFDPVSATTSWHPAFTPEIMERVSEIRRDMEDRISGTGLSIDHAKRSQAALAGSIPEEIEWATGLMESYVLENAEDYVTFHTPVSVDVVWKGLSKKSGIAWLAESTGVPLDEVAFVGDTNGDIGALETVGRSFAPSNADPSVQSIVDHVTSASDSAGVLEAYCMCLEQDVVSTI